MMRSYRERINIYKRILQQGLPRTFRAMRSDLDLIEEALEVSIFVGNHSHMFDILENES